MADVDPPLLTAVRTSGAAAELFCIGVIDVATVDVFRAGLAEATDSGCDTVLVDLALTEFMDSTGLAALAQAARRASYVAVRHANEAIRRMMVLTGLNAVVDVLGDE